jgi:hypothetical protein
MSLRTIDLAERRARLARRQHLAAAAQTSDPALVAESIVAYHATDPASVYLAAAARTGLASPEALDRALYDDRTLVRMLGMRRTMFVVPTPLMPVIQAACTDEIATRERRRTLQMITEGGIAVDPEAWLAAAQAETVRALAARGEATTTELAEDVPALRAQLTLAKGKPYESRVTMAPRVLFQLGAEGKVVRGRPVRSWVSNYRWALTGTWLPSGAAPVSAVDAEAELARRWLAAFGPGTLADLKWWTGWTLGRARKALASLGAVAVDVGGGEVGYVLPEDLEPVAAPEPWAGFLPSLDPAVMGWAMPGRDWYLGKACQEPLYDRSGNIGPTVWWDGRVVGGWAQRPDRTIAYRLLEDAGREGKAEIAQLAGRLQAWLGGIRVTPRFRTPLEKELTPAA